jgi:hypothetical protein
MNIYVCYTRGVRNTQHFNCYTLIFCPYCTTHCTALYYNYFTVTVVLLPNNVLTFYVWVTVHLELYLCINHFLTFYVVKAVHFGMKFYDEQIDAQVF